MNSPYMGKFKVTQVQSASHDGLDLVGIDGKEIHSTVKGTVVHAGWENPSDHSQGFGLYVVIKKEGTSDYYFFGHLSGTFVVVGDDVKITDVIGIEGSTGRSTGSHCHYCARRNRSKANPLNMTTVSGIPNSIGTYDDGYRPQKKSGFAQLRKGTWNVRTSPSLSAPVARIVKGKQLVSYVDIVNGFYKLKDGNYISKNACY